MIVNYGGLELRIVKVINFERQPVLSDDGTTYLFTKFTLNAVGLVNSQSDPNKPSQGLGQSVGQGLSGAPFALFDTVEPATTPVLTDTFIRHWMTVPRRTLVLRGAGSDLLRSPLVGRPCDCKSGPFCEAYSVQEIMGDSRTFIVHFQVTTYVNECEQAEGFRAPLLANRFTQSHVINADYNLSIVTSGTAYFRTDLIHSLEVTPDTLRPLFFLDVPLGFQREHIQVAANNDGSRVDYQFVDVQKPVQFVAGPEAGATHIQLNHRVALQSDGDLVGTVLDNVDRYYDTKWAMQQANAARASYTAAGPTPHTGSGGTSGTTKGSAVTRGGFGKTGAATAAASGGGS